MPTIDIARAGALGESELESSLAEVDLEQLVDQLTVALADRMATDRVSAPARLHVTVATEDSVFERQIRVARDGAGPCDCEPNPDVVLRWERLTDWVRVESGDLLVGSVLASGRATVQGDIELVRALVSCARPAPKDRLLPASVWVDLTKACTSASDKTIEKEIAKVGLRPIIERLVTMTAGALALSRVTDERRGCRIRWWVVDHPDDMFDITIDGDGETAVEAVLDKEKAPPAELTFFVKRATDFMRIQTGQLSWNEAIMTGQGALIGDNTLVELIARRVRREGW